MNHVYHNMYTKQQQQKMRGIFLVLYSLFFYFQSPTNSFNECQKKNKNKKHSLFTWFLICCQLIIFFFYNFFFLKRYFSSILLSFSRMIILMMNDLHKTKVTTMNKPIHTHLLKIEAKTWLNCFKVKQ